jgi:hypothetical protein
MLIVFMELKKSFQIRKRKQLSAENFLIQFAAIFSSRNALRIPLFLSLSLDAAPARHQQLISSKTFFLNTFALIELHHDGSEKVLAIPFAPTPPF